MSAISLKSISGITSITTPAGVDNQLTLHTNDTTQRVKVTQSGIEVVGVATFQDIDVDGHTNLDNVSIAGVTTATTIKSTSQLRLIAAAGNSVRIRTPNDDDNVAVFNIDDSTHLYYNSAHKFSTVSDGIRSIGNITLDEKIIHDSDPDTFLQFTDNTINLNAGGTTGLSVLDASVRVPTKLGINGAAPQTPLDVIANGSGYAMAIRGRSSDNTADIRFTSNNYGTIYGQILTGPTYLKISTGGQERVELDVNETTFNNLGADTDFRIRTPAQTHMFYVNAGTNQVSIKTSSAASGAELTVQGRTHTDTQFTIGSNSTLDAGVQATIYKPATNTLAFATAGANERLRITSNGTVLHGSGAIATQKASNGGFDISCNTHSLVIGADSNSGNLSQARTNNAGKDGRIGHVHYTNAEEPIGLFRVSATSSENTVFIGGGSSLFNAATSLRFYTAGNNTTTNGSERLRINSGGQLLHTANKSSEYTARFVQAHADNPAWLEIDSPADNNLRPAYIQFKNAGTDKWGIGQVYNPTGGQSFHISNGTHNQTNSQFVIMNNGDVGVNVTPAQASKFCAYAASGTTAAFLKSNTGASIALGGLTQPRILLEAHNNQSDLQIYTAGGSSWGTPTWSKKATFTSAGSLVFSNNQNLVINNSYTDGNMTIGANVGTNAFTAIKGSNHTRIENYSTVGSASWIERFRVYTHGYYHEPVRHADSVETKNGGRYYVISGATPLDGDYDDNTYTPLMRCGHSFNGIMYLWLAFNGDEFHRGCSQHIIMCQGTYGYVSNSTRRSHNQNALGTGMGNLEFAYQNSGSPNYYFKVRATWTNGENQPYVLWTWVGHNSAYPYAL